MDSPLDAPTTAASREPAATPAPPRQPGVWSGLGTVALYFLLQLGLSLLIGALIGVALGVEAGIKAAQAHRKFDPGAIAHTLQTNPDIRVILTVLTIAAAAAVMALIVHRTWPAQWARAELPGFGLARPAHQRAYLGAVLLGGAMLGVGGMLTEWFAGSHPVHQDIVVMAWQVPAGMRVLLALMAVCVAPFIEELVFRGVLLAGLARRMHVGVAIVVSALIFGCAHLPDFGFAWYPVPALVLLGLALGWMRVRTRSLWPSIVLHATNNFFAVLAWFVIAHHP